MDVADQIAVMNAGRIEQIGAPVALYDRPETEFVMTFVGEANRLGETLVRPHDLEILTTPDDGSVEAMVERITSYGFDARVELVAADETPLCVQLTRDALELLEIERHQIVWVRPSAVRRFAAQASA